ncbi:hypothetical protein BC349_19125 [Flavihumibacter stibioxidans]|uniref:PKD domain-containing protein n=1 Tax=Flavihumibacter stibioxidans TaxID=1834163 RepID=A0ABR7MDY4_9BACT|nr:hypothetical protein [Flavihumibacter stibioxidans]
MFNLESPGQNSIINDDTSVCRNEIIQLNAVAALDYNWYPNTGLSNTGIQNPQLRADTSRIYYLETKYYSDNLAYNGDFAKGNTGFSSGYIFCNTQNCLSSSDGIGYSISTDAGFAHEFFIGKDHTTGSANFLVVNGGKPGLSAWKQTITVEPNTQYAFGAWVSSVLADNPAKIRFVINGIQVGPAFAAPNSVNQWERFFIQWNSGSSNLAVIEITDVSPLDSGNDFGLDDIFFGKILAGKDSIHVRVYDSQPLFISDTIGYCKDSLVLDAGPGFDHYEWNTGESSQKIQVKRPGRYQVIAGRNSGCVITDSVEVSYTLGLTTKPLHACGDEPVVLNDAVLEDTRGKVIEFFTDSTKTYQLNSSVKMSTRMALHDRFNTAEEYKNYIDQLVLAPPTAGYGDVYLPVYSMVSNSLVFNGSKSNIAYKYTIRFYASKPGIYQFRTSFDFGSGGAIFLDGKAVAFNNADMWWRFSWDLPGQSLQWSSSLAVGMHEILVYGMEDCCDGGGSAEYRVPGESEFQAFSTLAQVRDAGTYYASLHDPVTGCSRDAAIRVTRSPRPTIVVKDPAPVCYGTTVDISKSSVFEGSEPGMIYSFFKDKALNQPLPEPALIRDSGTYYISGQDTSLCRSMAMPVLVKIYSLPKAGFTPSRRTGCTSESVLFRNTSWENSAYRYHWSFGTGNQGDTSDQRDASFTYNQPGKYAVTLRIYAPGDCYTDYTDTVNIVLRPEMSISGPSEVCTGIPVQYNGRANEAVNISNRWIFGNGSSAETLQPSMQSYANAGNYTIQLIGTTETCADTAVYQLKVNPAPVIALPARDIRICPGNAAGLSANGGMQYEWSPANGLNNANIANPLASPSVDTRYTVKVTTTKGCSGSDSVQVTVVRPFKLTASAGERICAGEQVRLQAEGADRYEWTPAEGLNSVTASDPLANPAVTTQYRVVGSDNDNCFTDTAAITVTVDPLPVINAGKDTILIAGESLRLNTLASSDVIRYDWTPSAFLSCTACPEPVTTPATSIIYTVKVFNAAGCFASDDIVVGLNCSVDNVFIPNGFTPNNDGKNDIFYPLGKGIRKVSSLRIFNRWGSLVFERKDFGINDRSAGWDGRVNGILQPAQTFVYAIQLVCDNGQLIDLKGSLNLIL